MVDAEHNRLYDKIEDLQRNGCGLSRFHADHELRIRHVEEIAIALGTLPADHAKRIASMEVVINRAMGAAVVIGSLGGVAGGIVTAVIVAWMT
jgi:hypothetical protein